MEIGIIISIISLVVAAIVGFTNIKRNQHADNRQAAAEMTTVIVKLETLNNNVTEMKTELRSLGTNYQEIREKLIVLEQSTKSAHHRIDTLEGKDTSSNTH